MEMCKRRSERGWFVKSLKQLMWHTLHDQHHHHDRQFFFLRRLPNEIKTICRLQRFHSRWFSFHSSKCRLWVRLYTYTFFCSLIVWVLFVEETKNNTKDRFHHRRKSNVNTFNRMDLNRFIALKKQSRWWMLLLCVHKRNDLEIESQDKQRRKHKMWRKFQAQATSHKSRVLSKLLIEGSDE